MSPLVTYSLLRLGLFAAVMGVAWLLGARGLGLLLISLVVSGLASLPLLHGQRDRVARRLEERAGQPRARRRRGSALDGAAAGEDEDR